MRVAWIAVLLLPTAGLAQTRPDRGPEPAWATAWSPFAPIADLPRRLPGTASLPGMLSLPAPSVGLLWTAGNPAGLAFDLARPWARLGGSAGNETGDFRRPLDPDRASSLGVSGIGWQTLGRGAVAGHVVTDQTVEPVAPYSDVTSPYGSDPLVPTDTSLPRVRRVHALLEGAVGWRFGAWGVGVASGVDVDDHRTDQARFPRLGRAAGRSASFGVARKLPFAPVRVGAYGRWTGGSETFTLVPQPGTGTVYLLDGYSEPDQVSVSQQPGFFRRIERRAHVLGITAASSAGPITWTLFATRAARTDDHFSVRRNDPPTDRWRATGWTMGGAVQRTVYRERVLLTAEALYERLSGHATRADLTGFIFHADESAVTLHADARYWPPDSPWVLALTLGMARESRVRHDYIAEMETHIAQWTPTLGVEAARALAVATISVGFAVARYAVNATIPDTAGTGPVYQRLVAPEISLYAAPALAITATFSAQRRMTERASLLLETSYASVGANGAVAGLPLAPGGRRAAWSVSIGYMLGQ
jgi:hypothetical protein